MPIRVSNVRMSVFEPESALPRRLAGVLGVREEALHRWRILRKSLDLRDKADIAFVYTAEVALPYGEEKLAARVQSRGGVEQAELFSEPPYEMPLPGCALLRERPVVVGSGPAGLACAVFLAEAGYRPLVLERGRPVKERIRDVRAFEAGGPLDPESNYLFGEGGAGTFSDGKLTCRLHGPDVRRILELFAQSKGKPSLLYDYRPHLGSNRLPAMVKSLRQRIVRHGGEFRFNCRMEDLHAVEGRVTGLSTSSGYIPAEVIVLAIGHSARDTYQMLAARGVPMVQKPFQLGVRIEQPQAQVNRFQYGNAPLEEQLGAADYSLIAHGERDLFTFCMCAGGQVIPSVSEAGYFGTNGMSLSRRASPFANSGLMITLQPRDFPSTDVLAGMWLQREYERRAYRAGRESYLCPIQRAHDFLKDRETVGVLSASYQRGVVPCVIADLLPPAVVRALKEGLPVMDRQWRGKFLEHATLMGPESRGSSPLRIVRDRQTLTTSGFEGLYPIGEGAGYAGGIVSAAVDGLRAAKAIIRKYAPLEK